MSRFAEFLFVGDLHLEKLSSFWPWAQALSYQFEALRDAFTYARKHQIKDVIILGDIFEHPEPEQSTQARLFNFLAEFGDLRIHGIRGNHDMDDVDRNSLETCTAISKIGALQHVKWYLSPELVKLQGYQFLFMSYPYHDISRWLQPEQFAVVCPHLEFNGSMHDSGRVSTTSLKIPKGKQIWVSGHLHTKQIVGKRLYYPGTMLQLNMTERLPKFFLHGQLEGKIFTPKFVPYTPRCRLHNLIIHSKKDLKEISTNDNDRYRLVVKDNVDIPKGFFEKHSNIYLTVGYRNKGSDQQNLNDDLVVHSEAIEQFDPTFGLREHLLGKGHSEQTVKRLLELANARISSLQGKKHAST